MTKCRNVGNGFHGVFLLEESKICESAQSSENATTYIYKEVLFRVKALL